MKRVEFDECFEQLTKRQREVLKLFLADKTEIEIAEKFEWTIDVDRKTGEKKGSSTVRKHLSNACKVFGFSNGEGEHYSYRDSLIEEFIIHQPDSVAPQLQAYYGGRQPEPEFPGRPLATDSPFYIVHPEIEAKCCQEILLPGGLVRIKGAKKMGKTSLLNRILQEAEQKGYRTVYLNFRQIQDSILQDLDRFLKWFCASISKKLGQKPQLEEWDSDLFGSLECCTDYLQDYLLVPEDTPLVVGMDEVDRLFEYPKIAEDFFALLRGWYENRNIDPEIWSKLRQVIVYSTDVYLKLNNNKSPFNVGPGFTLPKLTQEQIKQLTQRYGISRSQEETINDLMATVGGHPHLIQLSLYHLKKENTNLDDLLASALTPSGGIYHAHLQHLQDNLQAQTTVLETLKAVIQNENREEITQETSFKKLQGLGLLDAKNNQVKFTCQLYKNYFQACLS